MPTTAPGTGTTPEDTKPVAEPMPADEGAAISRDKAKRRQILPTDRVETEEPLPEERPPIPPVDQFRAILDLPQSEPIARAARYNALTPAQSMINGLGRIPTPQGSVFVPAAIPTAARPFRIGPLNLRGTFNLGATYGTISGGGRNTGNTSSQTLGQVGVDGFQSTAGFSLNASFDSPAGGDNLTLSYRALYFYPPDEGNGLATTTGLQSFNQQLDILGNMNFTRLKLGFGISFVSLSGANRDVGGDVNQDLLTVALTSSYEWSPKTSFEWDLALPISQVSGGISSNRATSTNFINYKYSPKLSIAPGFTFGFDDVEGSGTQTFERLLTRIDFRPSPLFSLSGTLGVEFRSAGDTRTVNPIFLANATWTVREGTSVTLSAVQTVQPSSSSEGQNFVSSSFILSASQRLGTRMNLLLSVGYERASYDSFETTTVATDRRDNLYSGQIGLNVILTRRWSASLTYAYANNRSNINADSFTSSRGQFLMNFVF